MPQVAGQTTTANTNNFLGILRLFKKRPNTILKLIGGLGDAQGDGTGDDVVIGNGWRQEANYEYPTAVDYDLPAPSQPARLEGAASPTANTFQTTQAKNVVQIFHEGVDISYLKMASTNRLAGVVGSSEGVVETARAFQVERALEKIAQDANYSFLRGTYSNPANPAATALATRGIFNAITTNVFANAGTGRALSTTILQNAYKGMIDNAGIQPDNLIALMNTAQMAAISALYTTTFNQGQDRQVGGVMIRTIYTAFGRLNIALDLDMTQTDILFINPDVLQGVYVNVPGKPEGLFYEPIAISGSSEKGQVYGQIGIDHGPEWTHARVGDLL